MKKPMKMKKASMAKKAIPADAKGLSKMAKSEKGKEAVKGMGFTKDASGTLLMKKSMATLKKSMAKLKKDEKSAMAMKKKGAMMMKKASAMTMKTKKAMAAMKKKSAVMMKKMAAAKMMNKK